MRKQIDLCELNVADIYPPLPHFQENDPMTANATETVDLTELESLLDLAKEKVLSGEIPMNLLRWYIELESEARYALIPEDGGSAEEAKPTTILRPIPETVEGLTIEADGKETIPNATKLFPGGMYGKTVDWDAEEVGGPTGETKAVVYEMQEDATFKQMFDSLSTDTKRLCLSKRQIKKFVWKHRKHLRTGGFATFFLFEEDGEFFVAFVHFLVDGRLLVDVDQFEHDLVWSADYRLRVVVPQLEPLAA